VVRHVEQLGAFVLVFDGELIVRGVSEELAAQLGVEAGALIGRPLLSLVDGNPTRTARLMRQLERTGSVSSVAALVTSDGERVGFAYTTRAVGDLFVSAGELVPWTLATAHELAHVELELAGDAWLTKAEACAYTKRHRSTLERATGNGELEAGGSPGKRMYRRSALDAWLAFGLIVLILFALILAAELLGLVVPGSGAPKAAHHLVELLARFWQRG
jgi:hypothetical protein